VARTAGVGARPDCYPECLWAKVIQGGAPCALLWSAGLCLSVVPSFDGVMDVIAASDPMMRGGPPQGKLMPSLLPDLAPLVHG
jgi:hypothetical protein